MRSRSAGEKLRLRADQDRPGTLRAPGQRRLGRLGVARLITEHQAAAEVPIRQQRRQLHRGKHQGHIQPAGLFGRLGGDGGQALHIGVIGVGSFGGDQKHAPRAQLRGLLNDGLKASPLHQGDDQVEVRSVRLGPDLSVQGEKAAALGDSGDLGAPLTIATVEQQDLIARAQPHHLDQVARLLQQRRTTAPPAARSSFT